MAQRKLDIYALLRATDKCDGDWLSRQAPEAQKDFSAVPVMRWAATVKDGSAAAYMLWVINEKVNCDLFTLTKHPELVYRLIASCGIGAPLDHKWLPGPTHTTQSNAAAALLLEWYPDASDAELIMLLSSYDRAGFMSFLNECGKQEREANEVMHAYDKIFPGQAPKTKSKSKGKSRVSV